MLTFPFNYKAVYLQNKHNKNLFSFWGESENHIFSGCCECVRFTSINWKKYIAEALANSTFVAYLNAMEAFYEDWKIVCV